MLNQILWVFLLLRLLSKYKLALESHGRTSGELFSNEVELFQDLLRNYEEMQQFAATYLSDNDTSTFAKVWKITHSMMRIFSDDMNSLLGSAEDRQKLYHEAYERSRSLIVTDTQQLESEVQEINQLLYYSVLHSRRHGSLASKLYATSISCRGVRESLQLWNMLVDNATYALTWAGMDNSTRHLLPGSMYRDRAHCLSAIGTYIGLTSTMEQVLVKDIAYGNIDLKQSLQFRENLTAFEQEAARVRSCLMEYKQALSSTINSVHDYHQAANEVIDKNVIVSTDAFDFQKQSSILQQWRDIVKYALDNYTQSLTTRLDYLGTFDDDSGQDLAQTAIDTFVNRVKARVSNPLEQEINRVESQLRQMYKQVVTLASNVEPFVGDTYFYDLAGSMLIWRIPIANLDKPDQHFDRGRELWNIWNRDMSITQFLDVGLAAEHIDEGLGGYFKTLRKDLEGFAEELALHHINLKNSIESVKKVYEEFIDQMNINHEFIR